LWKPTELDLEAEELEEEAQEAGYVAYANRHVSLQIDMARHSRAGIGPVVNYGIADMLLSDPDHKASMIADLLSKGTEQADLAAEWLEDRTPYQAALYMTNLEIVIDGNVKDSTLLRRLGDVNGAIKAFHKGAM